MLKKHLIKWGGEIIFFDKTITVYRSVDKVKGVIYHISDSETGMGFLTSECPELSYEIIKKQVNEYMEKKIREMDAEFDTIIKEIEES